MLDVTKEKLLTAEEVARSLGVTHSYVCRLLRDGTMRGRKIGRKVWLIPMSEVEGFREHPDVGRPRSRKPSQISE